MATTPQLLTIEQLEERPEDACHYEIVQGELRDAPPTSFEHSNIAAGIVTHLNMFFWRNHLGRVASAGAGFVLARDPDVLLAPDASFVSNDRLPTAVERAKFFRVALDLAVEVVSPSDTASEVADRVQLYLDAGVRLVWVVLPHQRRVDVHTNDRQATILHADDTLDAGDVLPGFSLKVAEIFE